MFKNKKFWAVLALIVIVALIPVFWKNDYWRRVLTLVFLNSITVLSLQLIIGYCGLLDFGRAAFVGLGGYFSAVVMTKFGFPYLVALILSGCFTALIGAFVGFLVRKSSFDYLTLTTIGVAEISRMIFLNWNSVTNGALGISNVPSPNIFGLKINTNFKWYYYALIMLIIVYLLLRNLIRSKLGRNFMAVRDDEIASSYSAINVPMTKLACFSIASFFTGVAGNLLVTYARYASPYNYSLDESIILIQMVILGGLGGLPGCLVGTAILIIIPEIARPLYDWRLLIMGFMMVIFMIWCPRGILGEGGISDKIRKRFEKNKEAKVAVEAGETK